MFTVSMVTTLVSVVRTEAKLKKPTVADSQLYKETAHTERTNERTNRYNDSFHVFIDLQLTFDVVTVTRVPLLTTGN